MTRLFQITVFPVKLGLLGATFSQKVRLGLFILRSRFVRDNVERQFSIRVGGAIFPVTLRSNFSDAFVFHEAFYSKDYEGALPSQPPKIIFDLGANIGFVTLHFKAKYPGAVIHCFEPDPENFALLLKNVGRLPGVVCHQLAVGARNERRTFYRSSVFHMRNSLLPISHASSFEVEVVALKDVFARTGTAFVDFVKIDIEGSELETLLNFSEFERVGMLVGELHPRMWKPGDKEQLLSHLQKFYTYSVREEGGKEFIAAVPH